jgi:hypothetical protein
MPRTSVASTNPEGRTAPPIREVAPNGVTGDNGVASAECGQLWIDLVVAVAFIRDYDEVTTGAEWAQ